jgi:16S rRNA (uracil1498-N3)-methyltransferase
MHRFYLPPEQCLQDAVSLRDQEAHHAATVLRLGAGSEVVVLDGAGTELHGRVQSVHRREVVVTVSRRVVHPPIPWRITLLQALPRNKTFETIVQKATELGAARIVPLLSERSTVQLEAEQAEDKRQKWTLTAIEALKQCGLAWLPRIEPALSLTGYLRRKESYDLSMVGSLQPGSMHPRQPLQSRSPRSVGIWIGPEGDFTPAELEAIMASGATPVSLGPRTLRCDTAAIYCLSMVNYELSAVP